MPSSLCVPSKMAEFMDLETFSPNWELISLESICTDDIMSCCIGLQNTLIVPTETSNIWLVGINTILTPILGKQVNIHPLGECIHPLGNRMQDISLASSLRSLNGSGNILHSISRGMNTPSRGMNIHLYFPVSELILCSYSSKLTVVR